MRPVLLLLPALLFHLYLGLALDALARRVGTRPRAWAWLPALNAILLFRIAGRSPAWAPLLLLPGPNVVVWALGWAEAAGRGGRGSAWGLLVGVPGANLPALGHLAGLSPLRNAAATALVLGSLAGAGWAGANTLRERVAADSRGLASPVPELRQHAARRLADRGPRARAALPALEGALRDSDAGVRGQAARALWCIAGTDAPGAASERVEALLDAARGSMGWALPDSALVSGLAAAGADALPRLEAALGDADPGVRWHGAAAFVRLGRRGASAVPALLEAMRDAEWNVRNSAGRALEEAALPDHAARLSSVLAEPDVETRYHVARALARLGPPAAVAVPTLVEVLGDADGEVRMEACWALSAIGPAAKAALPRLLDALADPDPQVRASAAWSMAHIGAGPSALSRLRPLLEDPNRDVREAAAAVWPRIGGAP